MAEDGKIPLFGAEAPDSGEILLDGRPIRLGEPADAVRLGIGYVPAERRLEGIVGGMSVRENLALAHLGRLRRGPFPRARKPGALAAPSSRLSAARAAAP